MGDGSWVMKRLRLLLFALLPFVAVAVEPLTLETTEWGDVHCIELGLKFLPMQRRAEQNHQGAAGFYCGRRCRAGQCYLPLRNSRRLVHVRPAASTLIQDS